ncbi:3'(2'),5'-bisphosphate nucleotidase CysQ [Stakelama saccharophila]|uniref:3'(2'),5-bisphosphonucleoside 3'(2')-phosphohydrolase n=1 Tax=Stakelama saccharophila TaxID=3075605 RepID=A0ABZ0B6J8_9SPHN|nr:3'(2'),5'-bisphosphate nucleotidase CysQ [Stakelama sp. W311]WNO53030.1 3'(2'),5'-bisphosphate nucleotidase CysQ [Stakelama sp. W311]
MTDHELAIAVAEEAGALLLALQRSGRAEGRELGALGDREANHAILARLRAERPDDCILSEESADDKARCAQERAWIVDPLDGTREFSEGRDDWAVHIGLAVNGIAEIGAVALPGCDAVYSSSAPPALSPPQSPPRIVVSRSRPPREAELAAAATGGTLVPMGSAGAKTMAVVRGDAEAYIHAGGQYEWDSCAPVAVARAAGLHVSRIDGSPLVYNCLDVSLPDLLVCRREFAQPLLEAVRSRSD